MAESPDYRPSKAAPAAGGWISRRRETGPEPTSEPVSRSNSEPAEPNATFEKIKRKKELRSVPTSDGGERGALREETPSLDTVEARKAGRLIVGSVATVVGLLVGFIGFRLVLGPSSKKEVVAEQRIVMEDVRKLKERNETEARTMLERARELARSGNIELAQSLLRKVTTAYPETRSASEAHEALSNPRNRLSKFLERSGNTSAPSDSSATISGARGASGTASAPDVATVVKSTPEPPSRLADGGAAGSSAAVPSGVAQPVVVANDQIVPEKPEASLANPIAGSPAEPPPPPFRGLPPGYQPRTGAPMHSSGWPVEIVGSRDGAMMVLVPGGPFIMGRDRGDPNESPAHPVNLSTFYIDKHEVTNRQFDRFVRETGVRAERSRALAREEGGVSLSEDYPAVMVSAKDAKDYADWAGKTVPTEAQWEKAARGNDQRLYPWGSLPPVWEKPRVYHQIDPVMSFPSDLSQCGAYDMAGNAIEWTRDWFDPNWYATLGRGPTPLDPTGPASRPATLQLTVRGDSPEWLVTARQGVRFDSHLPYLGFRCVLMVDGPDIQLHPGAPNIAPANSGRSGAAKKVEVPY
jgi:formylglycine-generating enzyme required for sulfatase activity